MPKIVHIDTGMELRGGQRQLLLLARGLRAQSWNQLLVSPAGSMLLTEAARGQIETLALPHGKLGRLRALSRLRKRLESEAIDLIHAHDGRGQTLAWLASIETPVRRVAHRRVTFVPNAVAGGRFIHGWKYRHTCDAVVAVSEFVKRILVSCGVPERMIEVIPDGVEIPAETPSPHARAEIRQRWGIGDHEFVVGALGASTPEKGLDVLVAASTLLERRVPRVRFVISSRRELSFPKLPSNPPFPEYPGELDEFFPALDLFAMPSRNEGLGSAALLAMSYGVPVVASRVGGLPETVEDGVTGWLVPPGSPKDLARAIAEAERNAARLCEFGTHARERAKLFSSDIMLSRIIALYERLLRRPRAVKRSWDGGFSL